MSDIPVHLKEGDTFRAGVGIFSTLIEVVCVETDQDIAVYYGEDGDERRMEYLDFKAYLRERQAVIVGWRGIDRFQREPRYAIAT